MRLRIEESSFLAQPGGDSIEAVLRLTNSGSVVDRPTILLEGIEPAWYRLSPTRPALAPGEEVVLRLEIRVPEGAHAEPRPFRVTAHSSVPLAAGAPRAWEPLPIASANVVEATLEVAPAAKIEMELVPRVRRSRHSAEYTVRLRNTGNVDEILRLSPDGSGESMRVDVWPDELLVAAGSEVWGRVHAAPRRRSFLGRPRAHVFWLSAQPVGDDGATPLTQAVGELHVSPAFSFIPVVYDAVTRHVPVVLLSLVGLGLLAWFRAPVMERAAAPPPTPIALSTPQLTPQLTPAPAATLALEAPVGEAGDPLAPPPGDPPVPVDPLAGASAATLAEALAVATPAGQTTPGGQAASAGQTTPAGQEAGQASPPPQRIWIALGVPGGGPVQVPVTLPGPATADLRIEPRALDSNPPHTPDIERFEFIVTSSGAETVLTAYVLRPPAR